MEFSKISTGNGFSADLTATTNNRLELLITQNEKLSDSISKLEKTIVDLDTKNGRLQSKVFWLTVVGTGLGILQIVQVIDIILNWIRG